MQQTSIAANTASKPHRDTNYSIILQAIKKLPNNEGIADSIAAYCQLDKTEVSRRLGEMAAKNMVFDTGRKGITVKACRAIIWRVSPEDTPTPQIQLF